ncbi:hypothetical protein G9A89_009349 [Geosiphon pyriformis]|nr:hypothetical protein G9A89_009349 [Geosiphon pyriformis]
MALLQDIFTIINEVLNIYTYEDISKIIPRVEKHLTNTGQSSTDLFESACASQKNPLGQFFLGKCYIKNTGTERNNAKAVEWYTKAA